MAKHHAQVRWQRRSGEAFSDGLYSRAHRWLFDGGVEVAASASPQVVPLPYSEAAAVDPEEAFVAALASCHMLWFLALAARAGHVLEAYQDQAEGLMQREADGREWISCVTLRPQVHFAGTPPAPAAVAALHAAAHAQCFIANSVRSEIRIEPVPAA